MADYDEWDCDECGGFPGHREWCSQNLRNYGKPKRSPEEWWKDEVKASFRSAPFPGVMECLHCHSLVLFTSRDEHLQKH